jgi:DTW domain-containing protein
MLGGLCVCALMPSPRLTLRTRVVLVIHRDEVRKPTNTGRLAIECLDGATTLVRGDDRVPGPPLTFAGTRPVLLFPDPDAVSLDQLALGPEPVTLIVPDGTWRQAQRVRTRVPGLATVPCAVLPPGPPSSYRLRSEPRPGGLATAEAIARALGLLDGPEVQAVIERVFRAMVERTLWSRGTLPTAALSEPLPPGASRDPHRGPTVA